MSVGVSWSNGPKEYGLAHGKHPYKGRFVALEHKLRQTNGVTPLSEYAQKEERQQSPAKFHTTAQKRQDLHGNAT